MLLTPAGPAQYLNKLTQEYALTYETCTYQTEPGHPMISFFRKILKLASVGYVPKVHLHWPAPVYSPVGGATRRFALNLLRKNRLVNREFFFIYQLESRELRLQQCREQLEQIRNLHQGQRGFIIANGPSLRTEDLELLKDEITIGSNKIHLAFDNTAWRPHYFTVTDELVWNKISSEIQTKYERIYILDNLDSRRATVPTTSVRQLSPRYDVNRTTGIPFSSDLRVGAFGGHSVTYFNLQLAWFLGINPVYIIGLDHKYSEKSTRSKTIRHRNQRNHFHEKYRDPNEKARTARLQEMEFYYSTAQSFSEARDWFIVNVSRDSQTSVFERQSLTQIL